MNRFHVVLLVMLPALLAPAPATRPGIADKCERLLADWKPRFEEENFAAIVAPPFVIAGDGGLTRLHGYRDKTILAATRALQATYFQQHPQEPILILLFESEGPYKRLAKKWFGDNDVPHFGFFRHDNIMLMNVGTGTGTLVHELVHALIKPDFPEVPLWFNEGLASLYEQCSLGGETITGLRNWRLPALQRAIREDRLRPLREMMQDPTFTRADLVGLNYAQARYLMMYLQEQGKLKRYYTAFRDNHRDDPTGVKMLEQLIAPQNLEEFETAWRVWVLAGTTSESR
jgi:hypothetical protein